MLLFGRDAKCNLYILMRVKRDDFPFDVHRQFAKRTVVPCDGGAALPHKKPRSLHFGAIRLGWIADQAGARRANAPSLSPAIRIIAFCSFSKARTSI